MPNKLEIDRKEADLLRQWRNAVKDMNPGYLDLQDDELYGKILDFLERDEK